MSNLILNLEVWDDSSDDNVVRETLKEAMDKAIMLHINVSLVMNGYEFFITPNSDLYEIMEPYKNRNY